jgi:hypothetical protein
MTLPALADLAALSARLGVVFDEDASSLSADTLRALAVLDDASALVRSVAGVTWYDPDDSGDGLLPVPDIVVAITLACAIRAFRNPDGTVQATVGDVSVSYGSGTLGTSIYLTKLEIQAIRRAVGLSGIGSLPLITGFFGDGSDELLVPVEGGGDPIPLGPIPWEE